MDPLSNVLETIKLSGVIFLRADLTGPYGVEMPPPTLSHPMLRPPTPEHRLVMFHIVREGSGYVEIEGEAPRALEQGDLVIVFDDVVHSMVDRPGRATIRSAELEPIYEPVAMPPAVVLGEGPPSLRLVCGMLQFVERGINPIFSALPPYLHIRSEEGPTTGWLQASIGYIIAEADSGRPGSDTLLGRLTELLFVETLRAYLARLPEAQRGWFAALRDPVVGRALVAMHEDPAHPWTVAELARRVAVSRSALAARFPELLAISPIAYLTRWRIRLATNLLENPALSLTDVALRVGYDSESAFSRAFKREMDVPPALWRRRRFDR